MIVVTFIDFIFFLLKMFDIDKKENLDPMENLYLLKGSCLKKCIVIEKDPQQIIQDILLTFSNVIY